MFLAMKDGILRPSGADLDEMKANQRKSAQEIERYFAEAVDDRRRQPQGRPAERCSSRPRSTGSA